MKTALIHDWLVTYGGAERVFKEIVQMYPDADLFSLLDFLPEKNRSFIGEKGVNTSFLQSWPFAKTKYRNFLPFMPYAIERFDLSSYDVIISSSHAVAKGVRTNKKQIHISYFNGMMDYIWWLCDLYLKEAKLDKGIRSIIVKKIFQYIRNWDRATGKKVDYCIANSRYMAEKIKEIYDRDSTVIYPPVDIEKFSIKTDKEDFYIVVSRLVFWKRINIIAQAFSKMPDKRLIILGDGPKMDQIKSVSSKNIEFLGFCNSTIVAEYMSKARAFVNASVEPFGIGLIEAQACGTPVIAYNKGGALETVIEDKTGVFFDRQHPDEIVKAVRDFEKRIDKFDHTIIHDNAMRFSEERFNRGFKDFVEKTVNHHFNKMPSKSDTATVIE